VKDSLKALVDEKGYIDVGKGVEVGMGITQTKLNASLKMLQDEGYYVTTINQRRLDDPNKTTTIKVLSKNPDKQDIWKNHRDEIVAPNVYTEDHGMTIQGIKPPKHLSWDRVKIRYKEDGGEDRDGTIELRPGAEGLDLGKSHYAQVRIAVGDNSYLKGMAYYNDKMPKGVDVIFNTNTNNRSTNDAPKINSCRLGSLKNSQINNGTADIGLSIDHLTNEHPNAVNINGAVSPITRDIANNTPVNIPPNATGNCTRIITLARFPPSASPASFNDAGTIFNVSSVERTINGNIIIHSATLPAMAE
jgi:hypothetical protein